MKIYKKCTAKPCSFLVSDTTLPSDNPLRFRVTMTTNNKIKSEKLRYDINREAAKIFAL